MAGGGDNNNNGSSTYFSEDIFINILQWLSIASCIARFRCVCRSWRILLSDPDFIRKIIFSQKSDDLKTLQILISGGCCDGIFCLNSTTRKADGNYVQKMVLWNPTTGETKIVPPDDEGVYDYDPAEFYNGPLPLIFKEVYSLRNDSWKTLNDVASHSLDDRPVYDYTAHKLIHLNQQWDITTSRNEKCYWFRREDESPITCAVISFDMSTEVFELVTVPFPTALTHHGKDGELCNTCSTEVDECDFAWVAKSCFMLKKDVIVVTFACVRGREIWVMLKRGVAESWTRLFTCSQLGHDHELEFCSQLSHIHPLEVWKDGAYICGDFYDMMNVYDIANSDQPIYKHIEIEDTICSFEARIFTPTRVSISQQVNSS
ncbi:hypothetical protein LINPERPRIM_LOCUS18552 [Linum perenne]